MQNCHLLVIPENGTIDVASTPAIPEEEPWDPPLSSGSVTRLGAADTVKDWPQLETKLECFPSDLEMPRAVKKLEILLAEQSNGQL